MAIPQGATKESDQRPQDPTVEDKKKDDPEQIYDEDDKDYLTFLQSRLRDAEENRDTTHEEFDGMSYLQYYNQNEKIANTHLPEKVEEDDVRVSAGTVERKLDALLSHINNLNLEGEVFAFDREKNKLTELANALTDIMHETEERDRADGAGDEEKKMARQRELLKQGTVFVQEEWLTKWETKKKLTEEYNGEFDFDGWEEKLVKTFDGPSRRKLHGPSVYLGDITEFYMEDQPYVFVVLHEDYEKAKSKYGKFENFEYVKKGDFVEDSDRKNTIYDNNWRLTNLRDNQVEIILYQDKPNDQFQIIINGVLMLPIGFPLSAVTPRGEYNVVKQVNRLISSEFAYGASFVSSGSVPQISKVIDEMLNLFVLKTRKSIEPAYVNTSGRVVDNKVLKPGRISMGIQPGDLQPIEGNQIQGVTAGESNFLEKMEQLINQSTVSPQFTGQSSPGVRTATESVELQRQARLTLGLTITVTTLLEKKCDYLRLWNILENWMSPIGEKVREVEGARQVIKDFRKINRKTTIEGQGQGERKVILTDQELPEPKVIREMERQEEEKRNVPIRKTFINPEEMQKADLAFYIVVNPKERESSPFFKLMFRQQLNDMLSLIQLGSRPNLGALEEKFSRVWGEPKTKLFQGQQGNNLQAALQGAEGEGSLRTPDQQTQAQGQGNPLPSSAVPAGQGGELSQGQ